MNTKVFLFAAGLASVAGLWVVSSWALIGLVALVAICAAVYYLFHFHFWRQRRDNELALERSRVEWETAKTRALAVASANSSANVKATPDGGLEIIRSFPPARVTSINEIAEAAKELPAPQYAKPTMDELYSAVKRNQLEIAMGRNLKTGEIVVAPIIPSVHFKLIGGSGFGKSCLAAAMLDIATTCNSPDVLRIALLDLEYQTSRLFEHLPHVLEVPTGRGGRQPLHGKDADEVAKMLGWLRKELDRRADRRINRPLLLVYIEEMLALRYEVDDKLKAQMLADLAILALRARKYGIFFLACMQTDYSTPELREAQKQFRTRSGFAIDASAARAAGFMNNELVKQNFLAGKQGQYLLEKPGFSHLMLAPLYDVEAKLDEMANPSRLYRPGSQIVDAGSGPVPDQFLDTVEQLARNRAGKRAELDNDQLAALREMVSQRRSQNEIVSALFPGMRNADAIVEYRALLAALVERKVS